MTKLTTILILLLILITGISTYGYVTFTGKIEKAELTVKHEQALRKINVKNSMLSTVTEFVFAKITNQYTYYYDTSFVTTFSKVWGGDEVQIVYEWPYTFSFGIKFPKDWNWCVSIITEKPGYITINSPFPSLISKNEPSPKPLKVIKAPSNKINDQTVSDQVFKIANDRILSDSEVYLAEDNVTKNITLAFSKHIQDIMNLSHENSNPIAGVEINYVADSVCK
jgi:hypothetical protein